MINYYEKNGNDFTKMSVERVSEDIEKVFTEVSMNYALIHKVVDWASDNGDNGMGYDYDNSYTEVCSFKTDEIIVENGKLWGFYFNKNIFFSISDENIIKEDVLYSSPRYGSRTEYTVIKKEPPRKPSHIIMNVAERSGTHDFTPADFPDGMVKSVKVLNRWEDSYGYYDGETMVDIELTEEAAANIDASIEKLKSTGKMEKIHLGI